MLRLMSAVFALFVFGSTAAFAAGTQYRDPEGRFNLTVPEGWLAERPTASEVALVMASPRLADIGGLCIVIALPTPNTKDVSQAQIDAEFSQELTPEFWAKQFQAQGMKDVVIDSSGAKDQRGRKVHYVVASMTMAGEKSSFRSKTKEELHLIPGSLQAVSCAAKAESYAELSPEFEIIFESYDPKNGEYIARATPGSPSLLTLYSGPRLDGFSRTVSQDLANLPASGWSGATASLVVAGFGQWEVCDGLNYMGNCRLVAAAQLGGQPFRIGSVRRYVGARDPRGTLGLIGSTVSSGLRAVSERMPRGRWR